MTSKTIRLEKRAAIVLGMALSICAWGARAQDDVMIYGPVTPLVSCGSFLTASGATRQALEFWILGFVSGTNRELSFRNISTRESDSKGLIQWAQKYCAEHPLDSFVASAFKLTDELKADAR